VRGRRAVLFVVLIVAALGLGYGAAINTRAGQDFVIVR